MPFFDPIPVGPNEQQDHLPRRWLAWYAIPFATAFVWPVVAWQEGRIENVWSTAFIWFGILGGAACILFSRPRHRALKWAFLVFYPFIMFAVFAVIDLAYTPMRMWQAFRHRFESTDLTVHLARSFR
jgi:hypothetical protein